MLAYPDLRFVVETVATERQDHDRIVELVKDKEDFLEVMLEDEKLVRRILADEEIVLRISPHLLFDILLRRVRRDLEKEKYVLEITEGGQQVPVFEAPSVVELLQEKGPRDYLVDMHSSFTRTESTVVYWMEKGRLRRRRFSDLEIDDLILLSQLSEPETQPALYKRIGDIALFISGIFPDYAGRPALGLHRLTVRRRGLTDYEDEGQRFYSLAAKASSHSTLGPILETLAHKFSTARKALNVLSRRYLHGRRLKWFGYNAG